MFFSREYSTSPISERGANIDSTSGILKIFLKSLSFSPSKFDPVPCPENEGATKIVFAPSDSNSDSTEFFSPSPKAMKVIIAAMPIITPIEKPILCDLGKSLAGF